MSGDAAAAEARIIGGLAREAAGLGVQIIDVAGKIAEVSTRVEQQARPFRHLVAAAGEGNDSNNGTVSGRQRVCKYEYSAVGAVYLRTAKPDKSEPRTQVP